MIAVLRNRILTVHIFEVVRFAVLRNRIPTVDIFEVDRFFEKITARHLLLSPLKSASALETCAYVVGLKKEVTEANKIIKMSFFSNFDLT